MDRIDVDYDLNINYSKTFGNWSLPLKELLLSDYMYNLLIFIHEVYKTHGNNVMPRKNDIFKAFKNVSFNNTRVVILGGEPINNFRGNGLLFGTSDAYELHPDEQTKAVEKCIEKTTNKGLELLFDYELKHWTKQGVLPLHSTLTTRLGKKGKDTKIWSKFTDEVIKIINKRCKNVIFILLGEEARKREKYINLTKHYVLKHNHPLYNIKRRQDWNSPVFHRTNNILKTLDTPLIKW